MLKGFIRKADIVLLIIIVVLGLASSAYVVLSQTSGDTVIIEKDGELYGKYSLAEDRTITIPKDYESENSSDESNSKYNIVTIKDGSVTMTSASCHSQVCVKHHAIKSTGESIICLPNKVLVKIEGKGDQKYDSISS